MRKVIVGFSGGVTSAEAAVLALEEYPRDEVVLLWKNRAGSAKSDEDQESNKNQQTPHWRGAHRVKGLPRIGAGH